MKITGTAIKLGAFALVLFLFSAIIIVVFGQMRFDRTTGYSAIFTNASGLKSGQFVRASGVEVGKVSGVSLIDGGKRVRVEFNVDRSLPLYQGTTASIRYLNLIGERYLELTKGDKPCAGPRCPDVLQAGDTIPVERTHPALDLDALVGSFKPLFRALDATKVNTISKAIARRTARPARRPPRAPIPAPPPRRPASMSLTWSRPTGGASSRSSAVFCASSTRRPGRSPAFSTCRPGPVSAARRPPTCSSLGTMRWSCSTGVIPLWARPCRSCRPR